MTLEEYLRTVSVSGLEAMAHRAVTPAEKADVTNRLLIELIRGLMIAMELSLKKPVKENADTVLSGTKTAPTAGTAVQLPNVSIPFDEKVMIKALSTNGGIVYIAKSKLEAEDSTKSFPLIVNQYIEYEIKNLSQLWMNVGTGGEGVAWTVVQSEAKS